MELLNPFIKALILVALVLATTFGWRPTPKYTPKLDGSEAAVAERLRRTVALLTLEIGPRNYMSYQNLRAAANHIHRAFRELGYDPERLAYEHNGQEFANIVAEKPGRDADAGILLVGAHYDTCFNPGADDNASGIAGLLELARMLKDVPTEHTIRFAAFTNEEPPFFLTEAMGSHVYARQARNADEPIVGAVILEMLGFYSEAPFSQKYLALLGPFYPNRADFIAVVGNFASRNIVSRLYKGFKAGSDFPVERVVAPSFIPGIYYSDHWSFWQAGYPAVMVTDTAYLRSPHYHAYTDLPDTLDYPRMTKTVFGLKEAIIYLDKEL